MRRAPIYVESPSRRRHLEQQQHREQPVIVPHWLFALIKAALPKKENP